MQSFLIAVRCLTILPIPSGKPASERSIARSRIWYPVVGLIIGLAVGACAYCLRTWTSNALVAAAVTIAVWTLASGALHLDGLADSFDGLFARGDPQRRLEIMRDPHVGAFGAVALMLCLLLKTTAVSAIATEQLFAASLSAAIAGRGAILIVAGLSRYAPADGTAKTVIEAAGVIDVGWALLSSMALSACWNWPQYPLAMCAALSTAVIWTAVCCWRIGGASGDCLGAACELAEVAFLLVVPSFGS